MPPVMKAFHGDAENPIMSDSNALKGFSSQARKTSRLVHVTLKNKIGIHS